VAKRMITPHAFSQKEEMLAEILLSIRARPILPSDAFIGTDHKSIRGGSHPRMGEE